ncbi:hypothetical protein SO802_009191 [Lithocarpus litseifolius]|uniref:RNase H type-1 domain-containing protein n=1 Tax=Lithocarpus litseifolius TaxID=425828 RepID=A0AAW2DDJ7_9ROSI
MEGAHRIKQNQEKINALGLKQLSSSWPKRARVERKRVSVQVNDDDYVPSIGEDDGDDESSRSLHNEMACSRREKSTPAVQHIGPSLSTHLGGDSLAQISTNVEAQLVGSPSSTGASTSRRAHGTTRGLGVWGLIEKHGKLLVRIAPEYLAPVRKHASKLACQIGVQDQFDLQGDSALVNKTLNTKCGRLLSSHSNKLFAKYKKLVEKEGKTYAKNHPPPNVTREKWIELIDGNLKKKCCNQNRTVSKHIHKCGSKSLAIRVDEEVQKNGDHIPKLAKIYHDTHFNSQKNQWVHPDCENTYQEMSSVQDEHCSTSDTEPLTEEEISVIVVKPISGYVKGLGMRPSSSLRTSASSFSTHYI